MHPMSDLRVAQLTDLHLLPPGELLMGLDVNQRLESALAEAGRFAPDVYLFTGDFCANEPVAEVYERLRARLDRLDVPYYLCIGNHDDAGMVLAAFPEHFRGPGGRIYGTSTVAGRTFVFLDTSSGEVGTAQLDWLARELRQQPTATIVMHHPPLLLGVPFMDLHHPLRDRERVLEVLLADGRRRRVLCGHYHTTRTVVHRNLEVYLCPPTSFHIDPLRDRFDLRDRPPGFQVLDWREGADEFRCAVYATSPGT